MRTCKKADAELGSPLEGAKVFPDHIGGRVGDYKVRIDKDGINAAREVKDLSVHLKRWNREETRMGDEEHIKVPSADIAIRFPLVEMLKLAESNPGGSGNGLFVSISVKFPAAGKEMAMAGGTLGDGTVAPYFRSHPKALRDWGHLDGMRLDDGFCDELAGEIKQLSKKLGQVLKNDPDVVPALKGLRVAMELRERNLGAKVLQLAGKAEEVSRRCDVEKNPEALLPVAMEARKGEDGEAVLLTVVSFLFAKAELYKRGIKDADDIVPKATFDEVEGLRKLANALYDVGMKDLKERREGRFRRMLER